jgi:hypothetical protein
MATEANISSALCPDHLAPANAVFQPDDGMGVLMKSKITQGGYPRCGRRERVATNGRTKLPPAPPTKTLSSACRTKSRQ